MSVSEVQNYNVLCWLHADILILNLEKTKIILVGTLQRTAEA